MNDTTQPNNDQDVILAPARTYWTLGSVAIAKIVAVAGLIYLAMSWGIISTAVAFMAALVALILFSGNFRIDWVTSRKQLNAERDNSSRANTWENISKFAQDMANSSRKSSTVEPNPPQQKEFIPVPTS